ncbi:hypothetical protein KCP73_21445 [Salmonella enterica subsp. enterica]|nr:hypothetical protein KCP73_21445 [Salmonella enterica subsp. enterica]
MVTTATAFQRQCASCLITRSKSIIAAPYQNISAPSAAGIRSGGVAG